MPIFHFHSADGERVPDIEGIELADEEQARAEAIRLAGQVLAHSPAELWKSGHWRVEVTDEDDALLFTIITLAVDATPRAKRSGT